MDQYLSKEFDEYKKALCEEMEKVEHELINCFATEITVMSEQPKLHHTLRCIMKRTGDTCAISIVTSYLREGSTYSYCYEEPPSTLAKDIRKVFKKYEKLDHAFMEVLPKEVETNCSHIEISYNTSKSFVGMCHINY